MKALDGIKILDFTHVQSGPTCTQLLAWFGADVIKVERPGRGDDTRRFVPAFKGESSSFMMINRNKRGLAIDLKSERGKEVFRNLVKQADVLVENFLKDTMPLFQEAGVGMVQTRWTHLNDDENLLTRLSSVLLDGHFVLEHTARNRSGRFFNFNGTAGVWRRRCIEEAGGWQHDTITEDLDLSYRAQLAGWRFIYLPDVLAPARPMAQYKLNFFGASGGCRFRSSFPFVFGAHVFLSPLPLASTFRHL